MDDKVFIFFILIPSIFTLLDYLLLRKVRKGMTLFYLIQGIVILYFIVIKILPEVTSIKFTLADAVGLIAYWYLIQIIGLLISIGYRVYRVLK